MDAPSQAVLFDLPGRRFLIFDLVVYPQDVVWLALLLFIAAVLLFFVTGLVGRAFCGYFCFQTLWTDFYIWIETQDSGREAGPHPPVPPAVGWRKSCQARADPSCCGCWLRSGPG